MKALLLCGGHGTRLAPLTSYCNKHLLPIYLDDKAIPIVELAIKQLVTMGIKDIGVILGDLDSEDIMPFFHKYIEPKYDVRFSYYFQGEPLGIAHAVMAGKDFIEGEESFYVMLGDNCFIPFTAFCPTINGLVCDIIFAKTKTPERFGNPIFAKNGLLKGIVEKPKVSETNLALTGLYYFNKKFYFSAFENLKPSARGEYELTDIVNFALKTRPLLTNWRVYDGQWFDAGTFESINNLTEELKRNGKI